ncbi:MAG: NAD(P)/FAD-dependent oxidoreductase [Dehalococcoidia bacterium]
MTLNKNQYDVIIIGGGIVGCATSYFLAKQGVRSLILERDTVAGHASGFALGGLNPLGGFGIPGPLSEFSLESFDLHTSIHPELFENTGVDTEYDSHLHITLAMSEKESNAIKSKLPWQQSVKDFNVEWKSKEDILAIEPRISPQIIGGSIIQNVATVDPYKTTLAFLMGAEKLGSQIKYTEVISVSLEKEGYYKIKTKSDNFIAEKVIFAMGPWTQFTKEWIGLDIPVEPLRGQILKMNIAGPPLTYVSWGSNYIVTKSDDLIWLGTTEERVGFNEKTTNEARKTMLDSVLSVFPYLLDAQVVGHTACLRPLSLDGLPILGAINQSDNLIISTGGGRKGILYGPLMAKLTSALITGSDIDIDISMLNPNRIFEYSKESDNDPFRF